MLCAADCERVPCEAPRAHPSSPSCVPPAPWQYRRPQELPSYFIVGGLVFTTTTVGLISMAVDDFDEDSWHATLQSKKDPEQQLVVLLSVLAHPINHGYETRRIHQLESCNDEKVGVGGGILVAFLCRRGGLVSPFDSHRHVPLCPNPYHFRLSTSSS